MDKGHIHYKCYTACKPCIELDHGSVVFSSPELGCRRTTNPTGLPSVDVDDWPQMTQSKISWADSPLELPTVSTSPSNWSSTSETSKLRGQHLNLTVTKD